MKIRTGFVSNSSSSSFWLTGKELSFPDIKPEDVICVKGRYLWEGYDIFKLTDDIKGLMATWKDKERLKSFSFYKVKHYCDPDSSDVFWADEDFDEDDQDLELEKDFHSTVDLEDFLTNYNDEYFEKIKQEEET